MASASAVGARSSTRYHPEGEEWVRGCHDVDVICDDDLPASTHGRTARITIYAGAELVGSDSWTVRQSTRRLLTYCGD